MTDRHPLLPADTPDYLESAWASCIAWALSDPSVLAAFRRDTGNNWQPGRTPLERQIDEACGAPKAFVEAFTQWANTHVWGPITGGGDEG